MKSKDFALALTADLFKVKKLKSVYIGMIIMFALIFLTFAVCWIGADLSSRLEVASPDMTEEEAIGTVSQEEKDAMIALFDESGKQALMSSSSICGMEILIVIITCIFVGKDFSNGIVRISVSRGQNRVHAYFSKWVTLAIIVVAYSLIALALCGIFSSFHSFGGYGGSGAATLARNFFLQILANLATMSITLMIAFLCRSSGSSLGASIGLYLVLSIVLSIVSIVVPVAGGTNDWMLFMPMQQLDIATSMSKFSTVEICAATIMPFVYIAASTGIGIATFLKRDIK